MFRVAKVEFRLIKLIYFLERTQYRNYVKNVINSEGPGDNHI